MTLWYTRADLRAVFRRLSAAIWLLTTGLQIAYCNEQNTLPCARNVLVTSLHEAVEKHATVLLRVRCSPREKVFSEELWVLSGQISHCPMTELNKALVTGSRIVRRELWRF